MLNASRPHGNMGKEICNKRRALWLSGSLPQGCLDDHLAVVYIYQQMVFGMGRNSGHSPESGWPGRGWQGYSLGVLEGTGLKKNPGILPKLYSFGILCCFNF